MRLYDRLLEQPGGELDQILLGGMTALCKELTKAQCFQLSEEISFACSDVYRSRPSSLLGALDLIRAPYSRTWVEWSPSQREGNRDNHQFMGMEKPMPKRVGALTITDPACRQGYMILSWLHHDDTLMVNPFGLIFDWDSGDTEPVLSQYMHAVYGNLPWVTNVLQRKLSQKLDMPDRWKPYDSPTEREAADRLCLRGDIIPLEIFMPFITSYELFPGHKWYESFCDDLAGELPFVEAFYLLLNSRNSIIQQERDDFTKLNNARRKNKKPPLKEFISTRLRISRVMSNRARLSGVSREEARYHLCRGHFKTRRTGVYWWSSHPRGKKGADVRREYEVTR